VSRWPDSWHKISYDVDFWLYVLELCQLNNILFGGDTWISSLAGQYYFSMIIRWLRHFNNISLYLNTEYFQMMIVVKYSIWKNIIYYLYGHWAVIWKIIHRKILIKFIPKCVQQSNIILKHNWNISNILYCCNIPIWNNCHLIMSA